MTGHKCGNKQFHRLDVWDEIMDQEGNESEGEEGPDGEGKLAYISLNAITSMTIPNFKTIKVTGHVGKQSVNVFIDCFIHPKVVQKL